MDKSCWRLSEGARDRWITCEGTFLLGSGTVWTQAVWWGSRFSEDGWAHHGVLVYISLVPRLSQILCFHSNWASLTLQILYCSKHYTCVTSWGDAIYHSFVSSQQLIMSLSSLANPHLREPGNKASMFMCLLVVVTSLFCGVKVVSELLVKSTWSGKCTCNVLVLVWCVLYHVRGSSSKNYALNSVWIGASSYHRMYGMFTHFHIVSYYYPVYGYTTVLYSGTSII